MIYTLAQSETRSLGLSTSIVQGKGSDLTNSKSLKGKAKRKLITQATVLGLIDISKNEQEEEVTKSYWNTFYCQNKLITHGEKLYGLYCKNRYCTLCSANRKADIINRYLPIVQTWKCPYFLTLTVKAVYYPNLRATMLSMLKEFRKIIGKYRKQFIRGTGPRLIGIRSLESNYNAEKNTYNPHFHIIVSDKETGEILMKEWIARAKPGKAEEWCQMLSPVKKNIDALIETVKYGSKIFTEPDLKKRSKQKSEVKINVEGLHNIFMAMKGMRIFDRFGFNLPAKEMYVSNVRILSNAIEWEYDINRFDWYNTNGESLSQYLPSGNLVDILENLNITDRK
jgi:plasmid rolling circle replication initiator protein Rep